MSKNILMSTDAEGVATLLIDVDGRPMNVVTPAFLDDFESCVERVAGDENIRGAIVGSAKEDFMAGADLKGLVEIYTRFRGGMSVADIHAIGSRFSKILRRLETCGKPFVAAVNGTALGAGLEIVLACHHRIVADSPKTVLGLPEVTVGLLPGAGGTQRLPRLIGIQPALELATQGTHVRPADAVEKGMVDAFVAPDTLMDAARSWLLETGDPVQPWDVKGFKVPGGAGGSHPRVVQTMMGAAALVADKTRHNYPAPISIVSCIYEGTVLPMDKALAVESRYFTQLLIDPVHRNMIRTLFINKGAADKLVRRPAGVEKTQVRKLGVLGAGMMGAGIAYVSARAGLEVVLLDVSDEAAAKGKQYSRDILAKRVAKGRSSEAQAEELLARIHTTNDYADLDGADLVIEAVFENRDIKAGVTKSAEAVLPAHAVFASNTSTLPITGLAEASARPERFIGLHFFSPVDKMPLVEMIRGEQSSDEALARALDYVQQIRKTPIVVNDSRGFYTSRVFGTYTNEGLALLAEGVAPALIENAGKQAGMPVGPLAVFDEVSIELGVKIHRQTELDLGADYMPPSAIEGAVLMVEELGRKGRRHGAGFYDYPADGPKRLWPGLAEHFPVAATQPDVEEVKMRLLYIQALETARCMDEGVMAEPADADVGSILGFGYPPWTGGTLSLIDTVGAAQFVAECDRLAETCGPRFHVTRRLREMAAEDGQFYPPTGLGSDWIRD